MNILKFSKFKLFLFLKRIFSKNKDVFYINGPELLPVPLTREEEAEILKQAEHSEDAKQILIERNLRLVVFIAKKFENTGINIEDLISIGTLGLIKGVNTFCADKNIKLATYASRCIENEILMYIRKNAGHASDISIDEPLHVDWDGNQLLLSDILECDESSVSRDIEKNEEKKMIYDAVMSLGTREREIITLRFGLFGCREMTQKEVADHLGISQSYISRLEKKIISELREKLENKI